MESIKSKEITPQNVDSQVSNDFHSPLRRNLRSISKKLALVVGLLLANPIVDTAQAGEHIVLISRPTVGVTYDPDDTVLVEINSTGGKNLYSFIKERLAETGQLAHTNFERELYIDSFIYACRQLNGGLDLDNFESINGKRIVFPAAINIEVDINDVIKFAGIVNEFIPITIPEGKGFLWIQENYGVNEEDIRRMNPKLKGRGLLKDEKIKIRKGSLEPAARNWVSVPHAYDAYYYPNRIVTVTIDSKHGNTLHAFIKAYMVKTDQMPNDSERSLAYVNAVIEACRGLNPDLDLDKFESIDGKSIKFPRELQIDTIYATKLDIEQKKQEFTTIKIPAGKGFLWIKENYGIDEAQVRELNPKLEGRGLHKDEGIKIPK